MREKEGRGNEAVALSPLSSSSSQSIQPPDGLHSALSRPCQLFFSRPPCATQLQGIAFLYAAWNACSVVIPFPHLMTVLCDISTLSALSTKLGGLMVVSPVPPPQLVSQYLSWEEKRSDFGSVSQRGLSSFRGKVRRIAQPILIMAMDYETWGIISRNLISSPSLPPEVTGIEMTPTESCKILLKPWL